MEWPSRPFNDVSGSRDCVEEERGSGPSHGPDDRGIYGPGVGEGEKDGWILVSSIEELAGFRGGNGGNGGFSV